ncbi:MAG: hypothetical protein ABFR62_09475 [Bacteroidota bacterium]
MKKSFLIIILLFSAVLHGQNTALNPIIIEASLDTIGKRVIGWQALSYKNNSNDTLNRIFLHSWPASYRNRNTNLGKRYRENRKTDMHYALSEEKGNISGFLFKTDNDTLYWSYKNHSHDIIELLLNTPLKPGETIDITTPFILKLPDARFTGFGYSEKGYYLKEWYLSPAVYSDGEWHTMSNKDLDDLFIEPHIYLIKIRLPEDYKISSNLLYKEAYLGFNRFETTLSGKTLGSVNVMIYRKKHNFKKYQVTTKNSNIINLETDIVYPFAFRFEDPFDELLKRQLDFLEANLGPFKLSKLWVSSVYLKNNPIYSMNTLPLIETMGPKFQKEIEIFKAISYHYIKSSIFTNIRANAWMIEGLNSYLLSQYIATYYPDKKLFGNLSDYWISKYFDLSELKFNDRQHLLYLVMARKNLDQPIGISYDKFANLNLLAINQFKASMGFAYLKDYIGNDSFSKSLRETFNFSSKRFTDPQRMKNIFSVNSNGKSDWFFDDYIEKRNLIDYKIKRKQDSIIIKNKTDYTGPLKVYGYKKDSLIFSEWVNGFQESINYTPLNKNIDRLVLNNETILPEYNFRDNTLKYNKKWYHIIEKPVQFKLMTDVENPHYTQIFVNPYISWNAYDGLLLGSAFYNKSLIQKPFNYNFRPLYAAKANSLTGTGSFTYSYYFRNSDIFHKMSFGMFAKYSHYDRDLAFIKYNPAFRLYFKRPNPRGVESNYIFARYINVDKELPPGKIVDDENGKYDEYQIFNLRHIYSNPEKIDDYRIRTDLQIGDQFGRLSSEIRFRKMTDWKNLIDFRIFAGIFFYNNVEHENYNFGINSSTDYLFDYNFLGRSETSGILSQQMVISDGGFKTKYDKFADHWIVSTNTHVSIWKFIEVYGDVGLYKNQNHGTEFIWDTGVRFNFVPEILEVYFPIYSNKGSEFNTPNYEEKIRFIFISDFKRIISYFRRGLF